MRRRGARLLACLAVLALCLLPAAGWAVGEIQPPMPGSVVEGVDSLLDGIDLTPWDEALNQLPLLRGEGAGDLVRRLATGEVVLDAAGVVGLIGSILGREAASSIQLVLRIVVLAAIGGVLQQMRGAFGESSISTTGRFVVLILCLAPLMADLGALITGGRSSVESMAGFVQQAAPAMMTLLVAVGGSASAAAFQPAVAGASALAVSLISSVVMPVLLCAAALTAVDSLGETQRLKRLLSLLRSACHWVIGISFTAFLAVLTIQGMTASSFDGISIRTAKYAIDQFVPVVGGMFADTMDVLIGCSVLVKNGLGVAGMIALLAWSLGPTLRIVAAIACYRVAAAVLEPVADEAMVNCLSSFASIMTTLLISVLSVAAMFIVMVAIVVSSGNAIAMIR